MQQILIFLAVAVLTFLSGVAIHRLIAARSHPKVGGVAHTVVRTAPMFNQGGVERNSPMLSLRKQTVRSSCWLAKLSVSRRRLA